MTSAPESREGTTEDATTADVATRSSRVRAKLRAVAANRHVRRTGVVLVAFGVAVGAEAFRRAVSGSHAPDDRDGVPLPAAPPDDEVGYRVRWKNVDGTGVVHERLFTNIDWGWDFYQDRQKSPNSYQATWEHVRGDRSY